MIRELDAAFRAIAAIQEIIREVDSVDWKALDAMLRGLGPLDWLAAKRGENPRTLRHKFDEWVAGTSLGTHEGMQEVLRRHDEAQPMPWEEGAA